MKLQTTIAVSPESSQIDYDSKVLLLGSCFAESMGEKLEYFKFQNLQNPFGIIFNPLSIQKLLERAVNNKTFTEADIFEKDGQWHCFEVHSLVTAVSEEDFLVLLNEKLARLREFVAEASHVVFTFGTAWVYRHKVTGEIVANCHKIPQQEFSKELLSVQEISHSLENLVSLLGELNDSLTVITTVSPVRHLKDGFVENTRSKSHLVAGVHAVNGINYFPSYELMMDELRDYRFYERDLVHPNQLAIDIIWDRFKGVWISSETDILQKEIDSIQKGLRHRPFAADSPSHRTFQNNLQHKIKEVTVKLPYIEFNTK